MVNIYAFAGGNFGVFQGAREAAVSVAIHNGIAPSSRLGDGPF
jgi:hypothetical protein